MLWSEQDHAKYRVGDLICLREAAKECGVSETEIEKLNRQIDTAIAYARSFADQKNAELRDSPPENKPD